MIYTKLTNKAIKIAYEAHKEQSDKAGLPYIFHPFHLAEQMYDEVTTCVALLHDVVEDTDISLDNLRKIFPDEITDIVDILTHKNDIDYMDYIKEVCKNKTAAYVKRADLIHNMTMDRFCVADISEESKEKMRIKIKKRYEPALFLIEQALKSD